MSDSRNLTLYIIPYVLIATFSYQFSKDGLRFVDPFTFMCLRYLIAGMVCFAIARNFRPILNRGTLLLSLFTFLSSAFWAVGLESVSPAESAVLSYTMPLFAIPLAVVMLKEKTSKLGWAGAFLGFLGVAVYGFALTSSGGSAVGAALSVTNAFFWALYTMYYRRLVGQDPIRTVGTQFFVGGLLFLPLGLLTYSLNPAPGFILDLGYVSLLGGVGTFLLWNFLVRSGKISRVTTVVFAVPAMSIIVQSLFTRALPGIFSVVGICGMFAGIYVSRLQTRERRFSIPATPTPEVSPKID